MLTVFEFEQNTVRFVGTADDPWWVASDVCTILEIKNVGNIIAKLDEDEKRDDIQIMDAIGRNQAAWCINESGIYSLVFVSRKPQAKRFKKWVKAEVLPSIRKTGSFSMPSVVTQPQPLLPPSPIEISEVIDSIFKPTGIDDRLIAGAKINAIIRQHPQYTLALEPTKALASIEIEAELVRPTTLVEKLAERTSESWSAIRVNKMLLDQCFQIKNPDGKNPAYLPTDKGRKYSQLVLETAKGRDKTIQSLQWKLLVLEAIDLDGAA